MGTERVLWRQPSGSRRGPPSLGRQLAPTEDGLRWCWLGWECCGGTDWGVGPGLAEGLLGPSSWPLGARVWVTEGFWMPCSTL